MKPKYLFNLATGRTMAIASFFVTHGTGAEKTEITQFSRDQHQLQQRPDRVVQQEFFGGNNDDVPTTFVINLSGTFPVIR